MATDRAEEFVARGLGEARAVQAALARLVPDIAAAARLLADAYQAGGKAIFFGNGGSAADAQHLAAELECRLARDRRPLPALALHANGSSLTAAANDYGYERTFARLLAAHARPGDVAVAISTSGRSPNVVAAAAAAPALGVRVLALTGEGGGELARHADLVLAVPARATQRVQEAHILVGHLLCEWVERELAGDG